MKYIICLLLCVSACVSTSGEINDPRTFELEDNGATCGTSAHARAEVLARLGIDELECQARPGGVDACADDVPAGSPGTIVLKYAPYMTGTAVQVSREPGGGWWSVVCSCVGCSDELGFDPGTWPARIPADGTGQTWLF